MCARNLAAVDFLHLDELLERTDALTIYEEGDNSNTDLESEGSGSLREVEEHISGMQEKQLALKKEIGKLHEKEKKLTEELKSLCKLKKSLHKETENLKSVNQVLSVSPLTENDVRVLENCKRKFFLYEECTGIVWDYSVKSIAQGYIINKKVDYLHTFCIKENVIESLWNEISKAGVACCSKHS